MTKRFTAYIDESGDEGFTWKDDGSGSTQWFFMVAFVVEKTNDLECSKAINRIKSRINYLPGKALHWADLRNHGKKKVIISEISMLPISSIIVVGFDKKNLGASKQLKKHPGLYLYTTRYLLERVSWFAVSQKGRVDCVFEKKKNLSYETLRSYIRSLVHDPRTEIKPVIDDIIPRGKYECKNLQIADCIGGAVNSAMSPDSYGNTEPSYLLSLSHHIYRFGNNLFSYGFKLFPTDASKLILSDPSNYNWLKTLKQIK
ncbi:MAG: DUF3800 domain-containing protein [Syntrophomonadaceae bacterium]|nr:DUF3800 domain-containing protein [Syntrophomonadaceae bacterium]